MRRDSNDPDSVWTRPEKWLVAALIGTITMFIILLGTVVGPMKPLLVPKSQSVLTEAQADALLEQMTDRIDFWYGVAEKQGAFDEEDTP